MALILPRIKVSTVLQSVLFIFCGSIASADPYRPISSLEYRCSAKWGDPHSLNDVREVQGFSCGQIPGKPPTAAGSYEIAFIVSCSAYDDGELVEKLRSFVVEREVWCSSGGIRQDVPNDKAPAGYFKNTELINATRSALNDEMCDGTVSAEDCRNHLMADPERLKPVLNTFECRGAEETNNGLSSYLKCTPDELVDPSNYSRIISKTYKVTCSVKAEIALSADGHSLNFQQGEAAVQFKAEYTCLGDLKRVDVGTVLSVDGVQRNPDLELDLRLHAQAKLSEAICGEAPIENALVSLRYEMCPDLRRKKQIEDLKKAAQEAAEKAKAEDQAKGRFSRKIDSDIAVTDDGRIRSYTGIDESLGSCALGLRLIGIASSVSAVANNRTALGRAELGQTKPEEQLDLLVFTLIEDGPSPDPEKPTAIPRRDFTISVANLKEEAEKATFQRKSESKADDTHRRSKVRDPEVVTVARAREWFESRRNLIVDDIEDLQYTYTLLNDVKPVNGARFKSVSEFSTQYIEWLKPRNAELAARSGIAVGTINVFYQFGSDQGITACVPEAARKTEVRP